MNSPRSIYLRHRFPGDIVALAVWYYYRFSVSYRDVEDLLAERGIIVSYETIRRWCNKFGPQFAKRIRARLGRCGDHWHTDKVYPKIQGRRTRRVVLFSRAALR